MSYCSERKSCKGCPIYKEDTFGNCKIFVKESKNHEINRRSNRGSKKRFSVVV